MLRFRAFTADKRGMSLRTSALLPRVVAIALVALGATAGLTYAAGSGIGTTTPAATATPIVQSTIVVPDVRNEAFVFAKSALEDGGFAWKVAGSVHGYSANTVVSQSPLPGTKLIDTGTPLVVLTLKRNRSYPQAGAAADVAPYTATPDERADLASRPLPAKTPTVTTPPTTAAATTPPTPTSTATTTTATTTAAPAATTAAKPAPKPKTATTLQARKPDFVVPGARREPASEIPLTQRASNLGTWLAAHPKPSNAGVKYWLYQNEWVVTGARLGWWHGADALRTLIAVDKRAQSQWGIGAKSEATASAALSYVEAQARK
jgi:PASTA domain-containing protein